MKVHEFHTKQLFEKYGIRVPRGGVASTPDEAVTVAQNLAGPTWVIKAQVLAGGRQAGHFEGSPATASGVRFASSLDEVRAAAGDMLGRVLVTDQTGPVGREVGQVYVEQACAAERELYLAMLVDRRTSRVTLMASTEGGVKIESVATRSPESIRKLAIDPLAGLPRDSARDVAAGLDLVGDQADEAMRIMLAMYDMFTALDASLVEINPLAVTGSGQLLALGATMTFDDNALFRHEDIRALCDESEMQWGELDAAQHGLNYVKLDGNIGCLASGAGLAMATVDMLKVYGGEPANFLDVPPAVEVDRVKYAFELILSDPSVEAILVNVFGGGIMRCDTIADAMILAIRENPVRMPLIVRLAGANAEFAKARLRDCGLAVTLADDMADAAEKVVSAAIQARLSSRRNWWQRVQGLLTNSDETIDRPSRGAE